MRIFARRVMRWVGSGALAAWLIFHEFECAPEALFGARHLEQGTEGMDGGALSADDLAHVDGVNAHFVEGHALARDRGDGYGFRAVDEASDNELEKGLHVGLGGGGFGGLFKETGDGL
jgi:hypothetical protein